MNLADIRTMPIPESIDFLLKTDDRITLWIGIGLLIGRLSKEIDKKDWDEWAGMLYEASFDSENGCEKAVSILRTMKDTLEFKI